MDSTNLNDLLAMEKMEVSVNDLDATQEYNLAKYGFYTKNNAMFFRDSTEGIKQKSNFAITPILRIKQIDNADPSLLSRSTPVSGINIMEIVNTEGKKALIRITVKELSNEDKFAVVLEEAGNYWFSFSGAGLSTLKRYLYDQIKYVDHIQHLGWQQEGFWAWANGVTLLDKTFIPVDEYGRVNIPVDGVDNWYYIEPFSKINENVPRFKEQLKFRHEVSNLNLAEWCDKYVDVYGASSVLNIAAMLTACFGDFIAEKTGSLPLIYIGGKPATGKTEAAKSILSCFEESPKEINLTRVNHRTAALRTGLYFNSFILLDEYKNNIDKQWIELMKLIYTRQSFLMCSSTNSAQIPILLNSMVFVCGQELPNKELLDRCILIEASKSGSAIYTEEERDNFYNFKKTDAMGKSHFIDEIISHRQMVINEFPAIYQTILNDPELANSLRVNRRVVYSYAKLLTVYKILWLLLGLHISYTVFKRTAIRCMLEQIVRTPLLD